MRTGVGKNFDGVQDQKRDSSAEILLNWNLFNGGSDKARLIFLAVPVLIIAMLHGWAHLPAYARRTGLAAGR